MSFWILIILVAAVWLFYPIVGAFAVTAAVVEGTRPEGAGFSFLPELIIGPPLFLSVAVLIDYFASPWGRWMIATICIAILASFLITCVRSVLVIRRQKM